MPFSVSQQERCGENLSVLLYTYAGAKIGQLQVAIASDEHVVRFDIAMNVTERVQGIDREHHLSL